MLSAAVTVSIGVFGLFHPTELVISPATSEPLKVESGASVYTLEGSQTAKFRLGRTAEVRVTSASGKPTEFILSVPGKIERRYAGVLAIHASERELIPVIDMDLELAVAAVVAAESVPRARSEALKAQAVVTRSFFIAGRHRHGAYGFCDTTHCQFLRQPPDPKSAAARATQATASLVLLYQGRVLAAMYSAECGGRTRSLGANVVSDTYPYFAVDCQYCLRNPGKPARGHGLGMCQQGATGMAADGAKFRAILNRYYPATVVAEFGTGTSQTPSKSTKKQSTFNSGSSKCRTSAARSSSAEW